jgi:hypothetical protein
MRGEREAVRGSETKINADFDKQLDSIQTEIARLKVTEPQKDAQISK